MDQLVETFECVSGDRRRWSWDSNVSVDPLGSSDGGEDDDAHEGWIEVESLSIGETANETANEAADRPPTETFTFNFEKIEVAAEPVEADFGLF